MTLQLSDQLLALPSQRALLGRVWQTEIERVLKTGYWRFDSPLNIHGMCRIRGATPPYPFGDPTDVLDILAIGAHTPGKGDLRRFLEAAKQEFKTIYVWEVWNKWLPDVLLRYGFLPVRERDILTKEMMRGFCWHPVIPQPLRQP